MLKSLISWLLPALLLCSCASQKTMDTPLDDAAVAGLLTSREYLFEPTYVHTLRGRQRYIQGDGFTFKVTKDTVMSDLPYYGRSNMAPMSNTDIGLKFTTKNFNYASETGSKGEQNITIKPNDISDIQMIYLTIFGNGTAQVRINSNSRDAISYDGIIRAIPPPKEK